MKISEEKKKKITEQILAQLYNNGPRPLFTAHIAKEIARDEEFVKKLLLDMEKNKLVIKIDKNPQGIKYVKRIRWRLSNKAYDIYHSRQ